MTALAQSGETTMNNTYKLVWNNTLQAWVVASELAKSHKKSKAVKLAVALVAAALGGAAWAVPAVDALPTGEVIPGGGGSATFDRSVTNQLTVNQSSAKLISNWDSFDIGSNSKVIFNQPDTASIALNRISGNATEIFGQLSSNGQLLLVNPAGITFGAGSQVNVGSLVASTLGISDSDFNGGNYQFVSTGSTAGISNSGSISSTGGDVALLAQSVINQGSINATGGNVHALNVRDVTLSNGVFPAMNVSSSTAGLIRNTGSIQATYVSGAGGRILLQGDTSTASSRIELAGTLQGDDYIVAQGHGISVTDQLALNGTSTLNANDGIRVGATINVGTDKTLSLGYNANGYTLTNGGKINLSGSGAGFVVNGVSYSVVHNLAQLQAIKNGLSGNYVIASDINGNNTSFVPIGPYDLYAGSNIGPFSGTFDGLGHVITGLDFGVTGNGLNYVGLFGETSNATIRNIGLQGLNVRGRNYVGQLVGSMSGGSISNSYAIAGSVGQSSLNATYYLGGLVGINSGGTISGSYADVGITGYDSYTNTTQVFLGGLVGYNTGTISNSYASGTVTLADLVGQGQLGGLVGRNTGSISNSYSTGSLVDQGTNMNTVRGGLVGVNSGSVSGSYWNTSSSNIFSSAGGTGLSAAQMQQQSSFAGWSIDAQGATDSIWRIYEGSSAPLLRGFMPVVTATVTDSSKTYDGSNFSGGSYSLSNPAAFLSGSAVFGGTAQGARNAGTYSHSLSGLYSSQFGYDIRVVAGALTINKANLVISSTDASKVYDGSTTASATAVASGGSSLFGSDSLSGGAFSYNNKHAGTGKTVTVSGVTVNDGNSGNNYIVSYADNTGSSIGKANLAIRSSDVTKVYDGTTSASGTATADSPLYDNDSISGGTFTFDNKNAGTGKIVTVSDVTVNDGNNGDNYNIFYIDSINSSIGKASLVISTGDVSKVFDGTTTASGLAQAVNGTQVFSGDSLSGGSYAYTSKNASLGDKTVTVSGVTVNDGNGGNNYTVSYADNTSSSIQKADLLVTSTNASKVYDGTTTAMANATTSSELYGSDSLSGGTFVFNTQHAGMNKSVIVSGVSVNDGNNGGNYNLVYVNGNGTISKADLHIAAPQVSKTYDGTTSASGTAQANSVLFGTDNISGGTLSFDNRHAGTGKTVSVSGVTVNDGNGGGNYNLIYDANHSSAITPASVVVRSSNISKTYDGSSNGAGNAVLTGGQLFGSDSLSGGTFTFDNKNVGTGKTVTLSGVTINDGNSGNNYSVSYVANNNNSISKALLLLQANSLSRVYDGTTNANTSIHIVSGQLFGSDSYTGGAFQFADKNVGNNKQLVLTQNVSLNDGNNGGNYLVAFVPSTTSSITPATLNIQAVADSKVYDGKINSSARPDVSGLFGSDRVTGLWQQFANDNAGTGKTINIKSGFVVDDGNGGANYTVNTLNTNSGIITPASLTLSAVTDSKVFEGNLHSTGNPLVNGLVQGDRVTGLFQQFADRNAGTDKTINIKNGYVVDDGNGGNNYTVTLVSDHSGVITPKQLLINAVAGSKVYEGGITSAGKPVVSGLAHGDRVTGLFQLYENKQVGTGKRLYIKSGYMVRDGNNGGNYDVVITENNAGVITAH
jgi:filamentous hemagglutinin family protein